eukprot:12002141-Alexandrium_andersonii.AAC.1
MTCSFRHVPHSWGAAASPGPPHQDTPNCASGAQDAPFGGVWGGVAPLGRAGLGAEGECRGERRKRLET